MTPRRPNAAADPLSPADRAALVGHLTARMGNPAGHWPELVFFCPFCVDRRGDESRERKLGVNCAKGKAMCFRCDYRAASLTALFRALDGGKIAPDVADMLAGEVRSVEAATLRDEVLVRFYAAAPRVAALRPVPQPPGARPVDPANVLSRFGWHYLTAVRGMDPGDAAAAVARYGLAFCCGGAYANRLIFPVRQGGRAVYFTNRYCGDHTRKSQNPPNEPGAFTRDHCLLGYDEAAGATTVPVVEGPFDLLAFAPMRAAGVAAVSLMGKRMTDDQLALLDTLAAQGATAFPCALDPDAGREAYETVRRMDGRLPGVSIVPLPPGEDPWSARAALPAALAARRPATLRDALSGLRARVAKGRPVDRSPVSGYYV